MHELSREVKALTELEATHGTPWQRTCILFIRALMLCGKQAGFKVMTEKSYSNKAFEQQHGCLDDAAALARFKVRIEGAGGTKQNKK